MAKITGLYWDAGTGQGLINKTIRGKRFLKRFTARTRDEAEAYFHTYLASGGPARSDSRTFRAAATHYLETETKRSLNRDAEILERLDPWIGHLTLDKVHQGSIAGYMKARSDAGISAGTVTREIAVVRRILTLAARFWRDAEGEPWLKQAPPLFRLPKGQKKRPHILNEDEQRRFLSALPQHLAPMVLFGLNTGVRESLITGLRWEWEQRVPEIDRRVFVAPAGATKNGTPCLIPINRRAENILDAVRGQHETHVFSYVTPKGERKPVERINNTGWRRAWKAAELPESCLHGPHNLRHTFASRLRAGGVRQDVIKTLLHHIDGDVTLRYAPSELQELFNAVDALTEQRTVLRIAV